MIDLSVIIPFYNCKDFLARCVNSVLAQNGLSLEVILIDDGSDDGSEQIACKFASEDKSVVLFRQENRGIPFARNKGLELISGEYFLFVDADDYIAADTLPKLLNTARENRLDILQTSINLLLPDGTHTQRKLHPVNKPMEGKEYFRQMTAHRTISIAPYIHVVRRQFREETHLWFDERLLRCQDFDFYTRLMLLSSRIMNIDLPYYYFIVDSDTSEKARRKDISRTFRFYRIIEQNFQSFSESLSCKSTSSGLMWFLCSHVAHYSVDEFSKLPSQEKDFWNPFIRRHILKNRGWMRPWVWLRYFQTFS